MPVEAHQEQESPPAFYFPPAHGRLAAGPVLHQHLPAGIPAAPPAGRVTFHEATPGHHFQIAHRGGAAGLNTFRRLGSRLAGMAYAEGWGLYAERLADEMGLYADDRERFGMLDSEAWRAVAPGGRYRACTHSAGPASRASTSCARRPA